MSSETPPTYDECKNQYLKSKETIDQLIIQTLFHQFSEPNKKYDKILNYINNSIGNDNINNSFDYQLNQEDKDDPPFDLLQEQYSVIKECKNMFKDYIENFVDYNEYHLNIIKFYYFKVTYLFSLQSQLEDIKDQYLLISENNEKLIFKIIKVIDNLREDFNNKHQNQQIFSKCYDNTLHVPNFYYILRKNDLFESYQINEKQEILNEIKREFQDEEEFLNDVFTCIEILGENVQILKYKSNKENLLMYTQYSLFRNEFFQDLVEKYQLKYFLYFDKYNILKFFVDPEYIEKLNQDEIVLFFFLMSELYLVKSVYLFFNIEQNLYKIINKLSQFEELQQNVGIKFTMQIIKDLDEKDCLEEDVYQLFQLWNSQPDYKVKDNWVNKEQIQLYIDSLQSSIKLTVIPELARFFFKNNESIPFQISNHEFAIVQHIIIGKQFYRKHPHSLTDQIEFWKEFSSQITNVVEIRRDSKRNLGKSDKMLPYQISQINLNICKILLEENNENSDKLKNYLNQNIDKCIQLIDSFLYQNIYRKKQIYYTLQSLFIKDDIVIPIIIEKLEFSNIFFKSFTNFLLPSFKQNFSIKNFIFENKNLKIIQKQPSSIDFTLLFENFQSIQYQMLENKINKQEALQSYKDIIKNFKFLNRSQYHVFKLNIEFYIREIEIEIEMSKSETKINNIEQIKYINKEYQFQIDLVKFNEKLVIRKWIKKESKMNKQGIENLKKQLINECSILLTLQQNNKTHKNIIKLIDYIAYDGKIELFLEYCENGSLFLFLKQNEISKEKKISFCIDILEGVHHLHENNILHGDLKPGNIVIDSNGIAKIIDYGSCVYLIKQNELGTKGYISDDPIQSLFKDYFSIGMILFTVLLKDNQFAKNFDNFKINQNQNKELLQEYFETDKQKEKQMIEDEFSPFIFNAILSLFNEQPYLRPNLSELIQILRDYQNTLNHNQIDQQIKFEQIINQKEQSIHSQQAEQFLYLENKENILKDKSMYYFTENGDQSSQQQITTSSKKDNNKELSVNSQQQQLIQYQENKENIYENQSIIQITENGDKHSEQQITTSQKKDNNNQELSINSQQSQFIQYNENKENICEIQSIIQITQNTDKSSEQEVTISKQNRSKQNFDSNEKLLEMQNQKQQSNQNTNLNEQNNFMPQIEIIDQQKFDYLYSQNDLMQYFIKKIDASQYYDNKLFEILRHQKFNIRKLKFDVYGIITGSPQNKLVFILNIILFNPVFIQILEDIIEKDTSQNTVKQTTMTFINERKQNGDEDQIKAKEEQQNKIKAKEEQLNKIRNDIYLNFFITKE